MRNSPEGRDVLLERPRVISTQVSHAWDMPQNTFGAAYAQFMGSRNFSPDDRPPVRFMDTDELAYVATRAREVHDFWHVLFGLPTDLIGETALKVIEFEQIFLPMCMLSVVGGSARFNEKQRTLFFQHYFPWASKAGLKCTDLMSVYYEKHFHEDLEESWPAVLAAAGRLEAEARWWRPGAAGLVPGRAGSAVVGRAASNDVVAATELVRTAVGAAEVGGGGGGGPRGRIDPGRRRLPSAPAALGAAAAWDGGGLSTGARLSAMCK
uniref:Coenzyme Q biosynthesis protein 4 homolog n=1 Tax=Oryza meridionalis TaxID=40149 RepID=A0A0E0DN16_9ORYZ